MDFSKFVGSIGKIFKSSPTLASVKASRHWNSEITAKHTKLAHLPRLQNQHAAVGRKVFEKTASLGDAIRAANGVVRHTVKNDITRPITRNPAVKQAFLIQQGFADGTVPDGYEVDHVEALCLGGKDDPSNMRLTPKAEHATKTHQEMESLRMFRERLGVTGRRSK